MGSPRSCSPLPQEGSARPRAPLYSIPHTHGYRAWPRGAQKTWPSPVPASPASSTPRSGNQPGGMGARRTAEGLPAPALGRRPPHPFVPSAKISISVKPLEQSPLCCQMKVRGRVLGRV